MELKATIQLDDNNNLVTYNQLEAKLKYLEQRIVKQCKGDEIEEGNTPALIGQWVRSDMLDWNKWNDIGTVISRGPLDNVVTQCEGTAFILTDECTTEPTSQEILDAMKLNKGDKVKLWTRDPSSMAKVGVDYVFDHAEVTGSGQWVCYLDSPHGEPFIVEPKYLHLASRAGACVDRRPYCCSDVVSWLGERHLVRATQLDASAPVDIIDIVGHYYSAPATEVTLLLPAV